MRLVSGLSVSELRLRKGQARERRPIPQRVLWEVGSRNVELSYITQLQRLQGGSAAGWRPYGTFLYLGTFCIYLAYRGASSRTTFGKGGSVMLHGETNGLRGEEALKMESGLRCCLLKLDMCAPF
jgi:hypothetical protein